MNLRTLFCQHKYDVLQTSIETALINFDEVIGKHKTYGVWHICILKCSLCCHVKTSREALNTSDQAGIKQANRRLERMEKILNIPSTT